MSTTLPSPAQASPGARPRPSGGLFRAVWRWHFYAGLFLAPLLLVFAITGLIYLFRFQIEPALHADLMRVQQPPDTVAQPYAGQLAAVERAYPDAEIASMTEPRDPGRSTVFNLTTDDGPRDVFVDPYTGDVLGALNPDTTLSGYAVRVHADLMGGVWGDRLMELAACWAVFLALSGYYLLWRGRSARAAAIRAGRPRARLRRTHAWLGAFVGLGLLAMLATGLPWTGFWGAKVQEIATANGTSLWSEDHGAVSNPTSRLDESLPHSHKVEVPWGLGASDVPQSDPAAPAAPADGEVSVANLDTAITVADEAGLRHPMTVTLPSDDRGVFSVIGYAFDAPTDEKTVHVDQYGGRVVSTYGFDDYPALAKAVSLGLGIHEGRSLGGWTFVGAAAMCLAVIASVITGPVLWWRRRPARGLGAPRGRLPLRSNLGIGALIVGLGVLLPFFGLSVLALLAFDHLVVRRSPRAAAYLGSG